MIMDQLSHPAPDGTVVRFSTTRGIFPNASSTYTTAIKGGQVTATLTLTPTAGMAEITAQVESITATATVKIMSIQVYLPIVTKLH
jgi:hypothetical protein